MRKFYYISLLLFIWSSFCFSQRNTDPTPEDVSLAKALKTDFPDDDIALNSHEDYIVFDYSKDSENVTVTQTTNKAFINLSDRSNISAYCFYDGKSSVETFEVEYRNRKSARINVFDKAYTSSDLFHNDARVKFVNLNFPVQGYRYHVTISKYYEDVKYFTKVYFNQSYPVKDKTITFEIPKWLNVELKALNFEGFNIEKTTSTNPKNGNDIFTYTLSNINGMYDVANRPGPTYVYPHILVLAKSYEIDGKTMTLFESTKDLYKWYKSLVDDLENDTEPIKSKVAELIKDAKTDEAKIKNIYYWVQDNIRYIAFEDGIAGFKPDEAANVFNKRYGDCKGMANLIKQMLIEAGFDARLTWIGTKHIAYDYSTPNLSVDNHMICSLFKDESIIFLDGTEKFSAFGEYAERIQGKQVLIENGDDFILKTVPTTKDTSNRETFNYELNILDDALSGTASKLYKGESRSAILYQINNLKTDHKEDFIEWFLNNGDSNIKVSNINISELNNRDNDISMQYDLDIKNAISEFDGAVYVSLDFDNHLENFKLEDRKVDYLFSSKKNLHSTTKLNIPQNYIVDYIPENISISNENFDVNVTYEKTSKFIAYTKAFRIKNAKIEVKDFEAWNAFITKLNATYNDQIILKKQQ